MTISRSKELERRAPRRSRRVTMAGDLSYRLIEYAIQLGAGKNVAADRIQWPSPKYRHDILGFFRDILGMRLWSGQERMLLAIQNHDRVAIAGGRKISKSVTLAGVALWWFCSNPRAKIVMTATKADQINDILWDELKQWHGRSGKCLACREEDPHDLTIARPCPHSAIIDGEPAKLARSGLEGAGFRKISGHTAREGEAVAGISRGEALMYILDEASGIPDEIHRAIRGNFGGGGKEILISNPTRTEGFFFDAFHKHKQLNPPLYETVQISSRETPNALEGRTVIDGLATRAWILEEEREYGADSPFVKIHVDGQFVPHEDGKIVTVHQIEAAVGRWNETPATGRLFIGLDPAGAGGFGDESAFAARRALKILDVHAMRGLSPERHVAELLFFIGRHRQKNELKPIVLVDKSGKIGAEVWGALSMHGGQDYELVGVQPSDNPRRQPRIYERHRDELYANLADWIRSGGAIPDDSRLRKDLHAASWDTAGLHKKMKATDKRQIVRELGRSPDRGDAVMLACWEPAFYRTAEGGTEADDDEPAAAPPLDPYATPLNPYEGALNPYGEEPGGDPED